MRFMDLGLEGLELRARDLLNPEVSAGKPSLRPYAISRLFLAAY